MSNQQKKMIKKVLRYGLIGLLSLPNVGYSQENIPLYDCYYTLKDKRGKEFGYTHYRLKESIYEGKSCYEVLKEDEAEVEWLFIKGKLEGKEKAYISKEGSLLYFEREETYNGKSPFFKCKAIRKIVGIKDKNKILIEEREKNIFEGEEPEEEKILKKEIDLSKVNCLSYAIDIPIINPIIKLAIGEKKKIVVFDPESQTIDEGEIEVKEKTKIKVSGQEGAIYVIVGKIGGERISVWISEDGRIMLKRKSPDWVMELKR